MAYTPLIVCAAVKMSDGFIVPGIRHLSPEMRKVLSRMYGDGYHRKIEAQGFVDQFGNFINRTDAWKIATEKGQIRRSVGSDGELFSENLY